MTMLGTRYSCVCFKHILFQRKTIGEKGMPYINPSCRDKTIGHETDKTPQCLVLLSADNQKITVRPVEERKHCTRQDK